MNYKGYTYKELLQDDFFLESQLTPTDESIRFWDTIIKNDEALASEINRAQEIICRIPFRKKEISADAQDELLNRINQSIEVTKKERSKKHLWITVSAAASIALFCILGWTYYSDFYSNDNLMAIEEVAKPTQFPSEVQLIRSNNNEMTIQGEESVIQYDEKGTLSINSEKVATKENDKPEKKQSKFNQLIVPPCKRSFLALSDGTNIWVSANSRVVYPEIFEDDKREIFVEGEVYLEVSPDKKRPFIVKTNQLDVNVLGTSFNVSAYEGDSNTAVVLVSGKVNIHTKNNLEATLAPSDMLCFESGKISQSKVNTENYTSWRYGTYMFDNEEFSNILNKLSKYYGRKIVWTKGVEKLHGSGTLNLKDDIFKLLKGLEAVAPITFTPKSDEIFVYVKP
ncbi:FecR family protein [Bacteroides nordii]|uniref:FecR family protein n=1 Tax=Bacteroides nordii TaxID=291645 RepID=UPI0034A2168E